MITCQAQLCSLLQASPKLATGDHDDQPIKQAKLIDQAQLFKLLQASPSQLLMIMIISLGIRSISLVKLNSVAFCRLAPSQLLMIMMIRL